MKPGDCLPCSSIERQDPLTGRRVLQLTSGPAEVYPLYYFTPTVTGDGRSLIVHRLADGELQFHRLDLATGRMVCLTAGSDPNALWRPWTQAPAKGVRELLGTLNLVAEELVYFDGDQIRGVQIDSLADRLIARVPPGRIACAQAGISPDGRHLVYAHCDRAWWDSWIGRDPDRSTARNCIIEAVDLASGAARLVVRFNGWITHVGFLDDRRIIFSHPPTEQGILMTDLDGGWWMNIRSITDDDRQTCHYHATRRGVMYEANNYGGVIDRGQGVMGIFDPQTNRRREYRLAARITHIGSDPEGLLWFGEQLQEKPRLGRTIGYCPRLAPGEFNAFVPLTEAIQTCGSQALQRAHTHPVLMPDRRQILYSGGDERSQTNHPCLLEVSDLREVRSEVGAA
jgi:hypothetical protein